MADSDEKVRMGKEIEGLGEAIKTAKTEKKPKDEVSTVPTSSFLSVAPFAGAASLTHFLFYAASISHFLCLSLSSLSSSTLPSLQRSGTLS